MERNSRIELLDFVDGEEVDDRYFDKPYYLLPGAGGEKAYTLLLEALQESGRIGIAKFVMRKKPHLAAVEAINDALVLSTMRFREELIPVAEYDVPQARTTKRELQMANQLVDALTAGWDHDKYTDEYRANLLAMIEAKQKHQKPELERQEPEADTKVVNLMERLRKSFGKAAGKTPSAKRRKSSSKDKEEEPLESKARSGPQSLAPRREHVRGCVRTTSGPRHARVPRGLGRRSVSRCRVSLPIFYPFPLRQVFGDSGCAWKKRPSSSCTRCHRRKDRREFSLALRVWLLCAPGHPSERTRKKYGSS